MATESAIAEASGQPAAFFALRPVQRNAAGQAWPGLAARAWQQLSMHATLQPCMRASK
ncbi:hypothetical protein XACJK48_9180003 [Xanthomonas citri pv. citri]|nr:hypothetical protein XACJK2_2260004 [Xanthomonas citri pv. citri]CEH60008.1 hypothetical protein XACJK48_9180003 [Xanthomonas citri pv. citri]